MVTKYRSDFGKLKNNLDKIETKKPEGDDRFWKLGKDKAGNGMAIIRFLPEIDDNSLSVVKYFQHWFQNDDNGRYLKEMCPTSPTSEDKRCPICEANRSLWEGTEAEKKIASKRKRKLKYISNILVIEDPINPENNGKVFLYRYGSTIYDRLYDKAFPKFESEIPMNPFDPEKGMAFKLKGAKKSEKGNDKEQYSYEGSEFMSQSDMNDLPNIDEIMEARYDLNEFIDPSLFKSYDELTEILDKVLNGKSYKRKEEGDAAPADSSGEDEDEQELKDALAKARAKKEAAKAKAKLPEKESDDDSGDDGVDDDYMAKLERLSKS